MQRLRVQLTVLLALLGLLVVAWGSAIFLGARSAVQSNDSLQAQQSRFNSLWLTSNQLKSSLIDAEANQRDYLLTGDQARRAAFDAACARVSTGLARARSLAAAWPALTLDVGDVASGYGAWVAQARQEVASRRRAGAAGAVAMVDKGTSLRRFAALRAGQTRLEAGLAGLQARTAHRQASTYRATENLALLAACAVLLAVTLIFVYLRRQVGAPAAALRRTSGRLAGGDLDTPVELQVPNELGAVARDLEVMRRRLAGRMEALRRLRELSAQVVGATDLQRLCDVALAGLQSEVGATAAALGAVLRNGVLQLRAVSGFADHEDVFEALVKADEEVRAFLPLEELRAGHVVAYPDVAELPKQQLLGELAGHTGVRSLALVPLVSRGSFVGLLALFWTAPHRLDQEGEALLGLAGNHIAGALTAALRYEEAERAAGEARAVFYGIADGVLLTDPAGRVTAMNRALEGLSGWTEVEARGLPYAGVLPVVDERGEHVPAAERPLFRALASGDPAADEGFGLNLLTRDGRAVPVAASSAPVLDPRGRVIGAVDVVRDVSRQREVDEVKSALISTVSHELRTPLTLIHGFAELLVLRDMPAQRRRAAAEEILEASKRLARLIDDLLSVSRMESGRLVLDPRPLELAAMVERILSPFRAMASRHSLRAEVSGGLPVVWGDPDKVEQILTNLVGNAIKYSPRGGEVLVSASHDGKYVRVSVRDQGIGMSQRDMEQLFQKFYRVDRDEVRSAGGTGLGLYITRRLVEMHGGRIWADSRPGAGSVFSFTLPATADTAAGGRAR